MEACLGNNGPDQGQTLAAADRWRTDGTERELAMLIEVRGGRSRYFSVPQSPIGCSLSSPPLLCSSAPAPPPPPGRTQQAVRLGLLCGGFAGFAGLFPLTSQHCVVASAQDILNQELRRYKSEFRYNYKCKSHKQI